MKLVPPFALAMFLTACAITPEDQQAAHQRQLEKEARENFIAMKAQEHPGQPVVMHDDVPPPTTSKPKPGFLAFLDDRHPATAPTPTPRAKTKATSQPPPPPPQAFAAAAPAPHRNDDTVYYWQVQSPRQQTTPRQQAAEIRYARELAKRPEDLTPEERLWAHEHY